MIVGAWLGFGWQLMLGQRLSNEQSNVGPTKYVAVGPTLNQRLGFGWRMVSVLAGIMLSNLLDVCFLINVLVIMFPSISEARSAKYGTFQLFSNSMGA